MSKILWIDDDHEALKGLIRPLERDGHEITSARNIASALENLRGSVAYELVIVDVVLPLYESTQASVPERIRSNLDAGHYAGEGLIAYTRQDLGLRIPIIVMSVLAHDVQLRARLEPYEISDYLPKGDLSPGQVAETVERALNEFDFERATILNLRSGHSGERRVGLIHAAQMKHTRKLYQALVDLISVETDPELHKLAASVLKDFIPNGGQSRAFNTERKGISSENTSPIGHDVFLSHNSTDKPTIEELARHLVEAGIRPWLDKWNLVPGEPWQEAIEGALDACQTVAVFLGPSGIGPWENEEMRSALEERVRDKSRRVIPVLLPGSSMPEREQLPRFLRRLTWVDFRGGIDDANAFHRLLSGIKGLPPGPVV
jgi:CheY-like chemotaxis protein